MTNGKGSCTITPPEYGIDDFAATFARNAADKASSYAGPYALAVMNTTTTTVVVNSATTGAISVTADVDAMGANIDENNWRHRLGDVLRRHERRQPGGDS